MTDLTNIDEATLRDIVRLVDGTLPAERKAALEERVSLEPELQAIVEQQLKGRALTGEVDQGAPAQVHATVAARARRGTPRPNFALALGVGAAMVAVLAAIVIVLAAPNSTETTVEAVAEVALQEAEDSVAVDSSQPALLDDSFDGLQFPNWEQEFGFTASGRRDDTVEGRTVRTTFYRDATGRGELAYTIVSGDGLDTPADGRGRVVNGVEFVVFEGPRATAITWQRDGRTSVLSGDGSDFKLMEMASWTGDGAVTF